MVDISTYNNDFSLEPIEKFEISDDETIRSIQIRPHEIAVITIKHFPNGDTQTKVNLFKQQINPFTQVSLR